jgi:hypothetical protein
VRRPVVDKVWQAIRNFHDTDWSKNVIVKLDKVGAAGGLEIGARRILNDAFHETLRTLDEDSRSFTYTIDDGPGPVSKDAVSTYTGAVRLLPITENNTTFVEWQSNYESKDDGAVGELCNPIYQALLKDLKQHFS